MQISQSQAEKILTGEHAFSLWSFSMLITRLKGVYARDPSQEVLDTCTVELNMFLKKFDNIMGSDVTLVEKL